RPGIVPERYQPRGDAPNVYPRPGHPAVGGRMARPILRLATRITRRTRATAVAIAFACMVLVGALSLADGLANGIASVADRIAAPPTNRSELFPDDWAYVRADLFVAMSPTQGGTVQAILRDGPLDPALAASLGLSRLETLGAVGFVRGSVGEVQSSLRILAL